MTEEQIKERAKEKFPNDEFKQQIVIDAINWATKELKEELENLKHNKKTVAHLSSCLSDAQEKKIAELANHNKELQDKIKDLEAQIEKNEEL